MTLRVQCRCGCRLKSPKQFAGSRAECPACGGTVEIPTLKEEDLELAAVSDSGKSESPGTPVDPPVYQVEAVEITDFLDPPVRPKPPGTPRKKISLNAMFETLLDPRSIQYMLILGGGLLVLGVVIWLVSLGIFANPIVLAIAMGIGTLAVLGGGWTLTLKTRFQIAGQALTFLGCVIAPLNLWFYHAQSLVMLDNHLWVAGLACCLIYVATVTVLRDPLFMYAVEFGVTLTALLLLADLQFLSDTTFLCTFLTALGLFSIHLERAFSPDDKEIFNRRRFGLPLFWSGHVQLASGLLILLGTQICGWMFEPSRFLFGVSWAGNSLSNSALMSGGLWLAGTYAYLYSDLVVRRIGVYTYLAAFCLIIAEVTIVGSHLQTEGVIAVLALTALVANLFQDSVRKTSERLGRTTIPLALGMSVLPVVMGISIHLRATSPLAGILFQPVTTSWTFVVALVLVAVCNRVAAYLFRNRDQKTSAIYLFLSAGSLIVAAAGLLREMAIIEWTQQAPILMIIPVGYLIASRLWRGQSLERPLVWIAHTSAAFILLHGLLATVDTLGEALRPVQGHFNNLLLGLLFCEATLFYVLAGIFRTRSVNIYLASAMACAAVWQLAGYWGQIDAPYYAIVYGGLGMIGLGLGRLLGLQSVAVYDSHGERGLSLRGRGLALFQSGNGILVIALLSAALQGLSQLAVQSVSTLTLTALLLTTLMSFAAIVVVPAGNWRRLYWTSSAILTALSLLSLNILIQLNTWQKLEIICVGLGTVLIVSSYVRRFLEADNEIDDAVTMGLWVGSLLVTGPLLIALGYYRFNQGQIHWQEEVTIILATILMLVTGYSWRVKSTTLAGGATLFVYLAVTIGQLAYQPQIATGVYLAVGGGLVFLSGLVLSIYREQLLELPDRIARREGVFQVIGWR